METSTLAYLMSAVEEYSIITLNNAGCIVGFNSGARKMIGYDARDVLTKPFATLFLSSDKDANIPEQLLEKAIRNINVTSEGWRLAKGPGTLYVNESITALYDHDNTHTGFIVISRNETERKVSEERFRLVVESAPNAMVLVNADGRIALVNSQTEKVFGYTRDELIEKHVELLLPERFKGKHPHYRFEFFTSPKARAMGAGRELFARRKDGTEFPVEIGLNPIETQEGIMVLAAIIDITERKKAEERFRLVVEAAPNAIVLIKADGKITLVNGATEKLFGYSRNELIGQEIECLIPGRFRPNHPGYIASFFNNPQTRAMGIGRDLYATRKDGSEFPVEIGLNPIESDEGNMVLASIIDITERKMLETNRLKNDFLANMSHELRTPLNAVLGFSELLIDERIGSLNAKQLEYLRDIHMSGSHLLQLINNVLDLAKIESGKTELVAESFVMHDVVEAVVNTIRSIADRKRVEIVTALSHEIDVVRIDKGKFRQILYNLLSNAIKFNYQGGRVTVTTCLLADEFSLTVADTGKGIEEENIKKLFIPFVQLDSGTARQHEGSGLGLALTKNIVELHGGKIGVQSKPGSGAMFCVTLPLNVERAKDKKGK